MELGGGAGYGAVGVVQIVELVGVVLDMELVGVLLVVKNHKPHPSNLIFSLRDLDVGKDSVPYCLFNYNQHYPYHLHKQHHPY